MNNGNWPCENNENNNVIMAIIGGKLMSEK
jgi:hypothetical protein